MLVPMKFRSFIWPHNPRIYEVQYRRTLKSFKIPFEDWLVQDLGRAGRVFKGEGEFTGPGAYDDFRRLAEVFDEGKNGVLFHPIWNTARAYFSKLTLREEPREDYVAYAFEFVEIKNDNLYYTLESDNSQQYAANKVSEGMTRYISAGENETLDDIAENNGKTEAQLAELNPQIEDPDNLDYGQLVRI